MSATGFSINNITSTCGFALNVGGDTLLSASLYVSGIPILHNNLTLFSSLNVSGATTTLSHNTPILGILNASGDAIFNNNVSLLSSFNVSGFTTLANNTTFYHALMYLEEL